MSLCSRDCQEYIGNIDSINLLHGYNIGIFDIGITYITRLYQLINDLVHLRKPIFIGTSGQLSDISSSIYINGSCRISDSGTRIFFNHCKYGNILFGGLCYLFNFI